MVAAGLLAGNGVLIIFTKISGLPLDSGRDLIDLLHDEKNVNLIKIAMGINHILTFFVAPLLFIKIYCKNHIFSYLNLNHFDPRYLLYFPLALISLYPLMSAVTFYMNKLELPAFLSQMDSDALDALGSLLKMQNLFDLMINLLLIGVIPAIGEEILFRGIIQKELKVRWSNPHLAIWVTAVIFSAFHFQAVGFPAKLMIGLVLGYAYYYSGSLALSMILHGLNNSLATISLYISGDHITQSDLQVAQEIPWISVMISTAIFGGLMYYIRMLSVNHIANE